MSLTKLEKEALDVVLSECDEETGFSDLDVEGLAKELGVSLSEVKGVVGSLVKKDLVWTDEVNGDGIHVIYPTENA